MENRWEKIGEFTERLKVPGGWVVSREVYQRFAMVFVPDPNHEWKLEGEKKSE